MTPDKIKEIIAQGEGIGTEFKTAHFELNKDAFDSVCAFLNRQGGHLLLGVRNDGTVEGVMEDCIPGIINNLTTNANNSQKLNPPFYLSTQVLDLDGRKVLYVYVPESSQVHSVNGKIFDRNEDGDFDITRQGAQVTQLYLRKQATYTENRIYPYVEISDFKPELFTRIRMLAGNQRKDHPWLTINDEDLLRSAGLFKHDHQTGKDGYTLAAILLLGKDETILSALPHHKTDAIFRVENMDRYDDRDDIRTNLIESYDRLMAFIQKHLPDKFWQDGEHRSSLRDRLFREVVSNLLIHREFSNGFPAKLIIEKDRVYTENWNRPHGNGKIDPANFSPFPKNPLIARFFKEIGRVEELGSGVRNIFRYTDIYSHGTKPEFIEGDIFTTIIPLQPEKQVAKKVDKQQTWDEVRRKLGDRLGNRLGDKLGDTEWAILEIFLNKPTASITEVSEQLSISTTAVENNIKKLKDKGTLERIGSSKKGYWKVIV